jgi:hypothetical protein
MSSMGSHSWWLNTLCVSSFHVARGNPPSVGCPVALLTTIEVNLGKFESAQAIHVNSNPNAVDLRIGKGYN